MPAGLPTSSLRNNSLYLSISYKEYRQYPASEMGLLLPAKKIAKMHVRQQNLLYNDRPDFIRPNRLDH